MTVIFYRILAVAWTTLIAVAYSIPTSGLPTEAMLQIDKAAHFAMFLGFGFLWMHALHKRSAAADRKSTIPFRALALVGIGTALSILAEVYQSQLPHRSAEPYDAAANMLGLIVAVGGFWWWYPPQSADSSHEIHRQSQ